MMHVGRGLLSGAALEFLAQLKGKKVIVASVEVQDLYAKKLAKEISAELFTIPSGEKTKSLSAAFHLIEELSKIGAGKDTTLIAMGGGVTTDLSAFVASIYMRGIPLVLIPTTLLGCVDAAIGGKTAIDTRFGKNLIGTFYLPLAVFADLDTLQTLPEKEWMNGLAEILKMGLIQDPVIWELAKKDIKDPNLIVRAIEGKMAIVEKDPKDQGIRRILNFGHTIGHAIEAVAQYEMAHGEAVALGCLAESHLSMRLGYLAPKDLEEIQTMYHRFSWKLPSAYRRDLLLSALLHDKKKVGGTPRFVLIDRIGHAIPFEGAYVKEVSFDELEASLNWIENESFQ
jgi:3-dehydroquinate synthase